MAKKMKKTEVVEALKLTNVKFDENENYSKLLHLLKTLQKTTPVILTPVNPEPSEPPVEEVEIKDGENVLYKISKTLFDRAKEKVGLRIDQIKSLGSKDALVKFLNKVSPKTNPDARPKQSKVKPATTFPPMPDKFEFESKLEAQFITQNRAQFDENSLQAKLREINRKHGPQKPVRITMDRTFKLVKGVTKDNLSAKFLITKYEIYMKE